MRKALVATLTAVGLLVAVPSSAVEVKKDPEACEAFNPAQPKCTFTVTSDSSSGTVTGAVGAGEWIVVIKRGKSKIKYASPTEPGPVAFDYEIGDKVTATVKSAGGWVIAGHD
ncbi:MAG TPA: hypothetical protein VE174_08850 [Actinomycetota bacterium]|nr:hypothetical protein [Actinomycetota bacterium]